MIDSELKIINPVVKSGVRNALHNLRSILVARRASSPQSPFDLPDSYQDIYYWHAISKGACFYGIESNFQNYAGCDDRLYSAVEHGLYLGKYYNKSEGELSGLPCLLTFGKRRLQHIREQSDTPVIMCGPLIHYADSFFKDDVLSDLKSSFGRTMLVFPSHSIESVSCFFDLDGFVDKVEHLARSLDVKTVLFCIYFHDFNLGMGNELLKRGKDVVCAGHRSDPHFLERLTGLLLLSDCTASNSVGTHIGYSIYLNRPHYLIEDKISREMEPCFDESSALRSSALAEEREIAEVLRDGTPEQMHDLLNEFWGFDQVKSKREILDLFHYSKQAYELMRSGHSQIEAWNMLGEVRL